MEEGSRRSVEVASIARAKGFAVTTRSVRDFEACGLEIINPFEPGAGADLAAGERHAATHPAVG